MRKSKATKKKVVGKPRGRNGGRHALGNSASDRRGRSLYCTSYEHDILQAFLDLMHISDDINKDTEGAEGGVYYIFRQFAVWWNAPGRGLPHMPETERPGEFRVNTVYRVSDYGNIRISALYRAWKKEHGAEALANFIAAKESAIPAYGV